MAPPPLLWHSFFILVSALHSSIRKQITFAARLIVLAAETFNDRLERQRINGQMRFHFASLLEFGLIAAALGYSAAHRAQQNQFAMRTCGAVDKLCMQRLARGEKQWRHGGVH